MTDTQNTSRTRPVPTSGGTLTPTKTTTFDVETRTAATPTTRLLASLLPAGSRRPCIADPGWQALPSSS